MAKSLFDNIQIGHLTLKNRIVDKLAEQDNQPPA